MQHAPIAAVLLAAAVILPAAQAGTIRHDRLDSQYTGLAASPAYDAVGMLTYNTSAGGFLCSGTAIASSWVVTAAHCLDDGTTSNVQFQVGGTTYGGADWLVAPTWSGNLDDGNDIALLRLGSDITGVSFAKVNPGIFDLGTVGTHVGFGNTGTGASGFTNGTFGTKRAGNNAIDGVIFGAYGNILVTDFDNPSGGDVNISGSAIPLDLEYLIAPGDSGGGLFFDYLGTTYLTGVHSFGASVDGNLDSDYGDFSGSTRIAEYWDWIRAVTAPAPAPASLALLLLGLAGLRLARRR